MKWFWSLIPHISDVFIFCSSDATVTDARSGVSTTRYATVTDAIPRAATYDDAAYEDASAESNTDGDNAEEKIANAVAVILGVVVIVLLVVLIRLCCSFKRKSDMYVSYKQCVQEQNIYI